MDTVFNMLAFIRNIIILFILCTPGISLNGSDLNTSKLKTNFNLKLNTTAINLERATFTKLLSSTPTKTTTTTVPTINTAKKTMEMTTETAILTSGVGVLVGGAEVEVASTLNRDTIYDSTINKVNIPTSVYPLKQQQQQQLEKAEDESQQPQVPGRNITNWQQKAATVKLTASLTEPPPPPPPQPSEAAATTTALTFTTLTMHTQRQPIKSVVTTTTKAIMEIKENKVNNVARITTTNIINSTNSNNNDGNEFKKHQKKKKKKKHEVEVEEEMTNHKEDKGTSVPGINERYDNNRNVHKNGSLWKHLAPSYYNMSRNRNMNITKRAQKPVMLSGLKRIQQLKYEERRRLYEQMIMRTVNDSLKSVINSDDGGRGGGSSNSNDSNGIKDNTSRYFTGKLEINRFINNGNQALSNDSKKITLDGNGNNNNSSSNHTNPVSFLINAQHKYHKLLNHNPLSLDIATATTAAIESQLPILTRSEAQQTKLPSKLLSVVKEETAKESLTITIPTTATTTTTTATITLDHSPLILQQQQQQQQQSKLKMLWQSLNHSKNKNTNNNNINSNGNINNNITNNNNNNNTNKIKESFSKVTATVTATTIPATPTLWSNITEKVLSGITSILTTAIRAEKLSLNQMSENVLTRLTLMNRAATTTSIPYVYIPTITTTTTTTTATIATPLYPASPLLASTPTTTANTSPSSLAMSATKAETAITATSTATTSTIVKTTRRRIVVTTTLKPPPTIDDYQTIISQAGTHAYLPCNVKQLVKKPISWLRVVDGHILTVDQTTFIADQRFQAIYAVNPERWSLQIKYVQLKDAGTYECQVSTEPKASAIVYLHVVEPKTDIVGAPTRHVKAGSQVKLHCIISQALEPPLFINWFYNQKQIYLHNHKGWHTQIERIDIPPETTTIPTPTITPQAKLSVMTSTVENVNSSTNTRTSTSSTIDTDGDDGRGNIMAASVDSTGSTSSSISATLGITSKVKKEKYQQREEQQGMSVTWQPSLPRLNVNNSQQPTSDVLLVAMPTDTSHPTTTPVVDVDANLTVSTTDETLITIPMTSDSSISSSSSSSSSNALFTQPSYNTYGWSPLPERTISDIETSFMTLSPLMTVSVVKQITIASLIIPSVQKQDSGNYTCSPSNSQRRTVVLHVLNGEYSASAITSSATETDYQLSCYILAFYSLVTKCLFIKKPFCRHYGGG